MALLLMLLVGIAGTLFVLCAGLAVFLVISVVMSGSDLSKREELAVYLVLIGFDCLLTIGGIAGAWVLAFRIWHPGG
jgi:hypothetical protein